MLKNLLWVSLIGLVSLVLFWSPFMGRAQELWGIEFGRQGMNVVVQNFDGLNFLVIAKSWYSPKAIEQINSQFLTGNDPLYFSAHFPIFAGVIKIFNVILPLPQAFLAAIILSNILLAIGLYWFFVTVIKRQELAMILTLVGLFFPARMLSVRGVGSNEPLFIALILVSLTYMIKQKYWLSAVAGALAVLTRSPGILLFAAYVLVLWRRPKDLVPYLVMPVALLGLFAFYGWRYQDLLAYFHSGDNLHLFFPPFLIFSNTASWINDMWREDIIYLYVFYGIGIAMVNGQWSMVKKWGVVYGITLLFVAHRDLARYALPLAPLALLGYAPLIAKIPKQAWWVLAVMLIPIYLFSWQFILQNIQPISDWSVFI